MAVPYMDVTVGEKRRRELLQRLLQKAQAEAGAQVPGFGQGGGRGLGIGPGGVSRAALQGGTRAISPFRARNPYTILTGMDHVPEWLRDRLGPGGYSPAPPEARSAAPGRPVVPPGQGGSPVPPVGQPAPPIPVSDIPGSLPPTQPGPPAAGGGGFVGLDPAIQAALMGQQPAPTANDFRYDRILREFGF